MAAVSVTCAGFGSSLELSVKAYNDQMIGRSSSSVSLGSARTGVFPSIRTLRLQVRAAKPETVQKVSDIVRKQLALSPETALTPETTFTELGADSLDTVEIVMGLEEAFDITVEEDSAENITNIQQAADLIEKICNKA